MGFIMANFLDAFDTVKQAEEGATLHFKFPQTGDYAYNDGEPVTITVKGPRSSSGRKAIGRMLARSKAILRKYDKKPDAIVSDEDSDTLRKIRAEAYSELATNWTGFEGSDGKTIPMTQPNVADVLYKYWELLDQLHEFMEQKENFLKS